MPCDSPIPTASRPTASRKASAGFSLLEVIVTLALVSLVSTLLFQSVTRQWSAMQRISAAFDRTRETALREGVFRDVVGRAMPAWPEQGDQRFRGTQDGFQTVTERPLFGEETGMARLAVSVDAGGRLVLSQDGEGVVVLDDVREARFRYRALDGAWLDRWPPETNPGNGFFNDGQYFDTPPLPEAVHLSFRRNGKPQDWVVALENATGLPFRIQDVE